ncbi:Elongation factor 1-alpha [Thelohanellus kitauei]|uniref:Elongation factor 1-alpha n=1 Tax=Thelohanellus kitauei TaxID=669202 RepID=A0A0C2MAZ1_THEKT|nr:Elongation factor 1-alpha [Thelohanellus kitauei]
MDKIINFIKYDHSDLNNCMIAHFEICANERRRDSAHFDNCQDEIYDDVWYAAADVAILVTDTPETLKDGSELHGQTFEHVQIARCLGITQFIILINKMDLVDYREDIYDQACSLLTKNLKKLKIKVRILVTGSYISFHSNFSIFWGNKQTNWYKGPSFVDSVDSLACPERDLNSPLRLSISGSFEVKHRTFTLFSRVESGVLKLPASLQVFPLNQQIEIINVDGLEEGEFGAGSQLCLLVNTASDDDIEVGSIACPINCPPFITETFTGSIILFETPQPLLIGSQLTLHYLQISQTVKIIKIISLKDKTGAEKRNPRLIMSNARADVIFRSSEPLVVDLFEKTKSMGRFLLRFKGSTVGTGKIIRVP